MDAGFVEFAIFLGITAVWMLVIYGIARLKGE